MELTLSRKPLLNALAAAQGIAERKTTMPILGHVLLEPNADRLVIKATDLEVGLSNSAPYGSLNLAATTSPLTLHAHKLFQVVRESVDDEILLKTLDNDWVELKCGRSRFKMMTLDPREFPAMPTGAGKVGKLLATLTMKSDLLREIFEATSFAVNPDEARYNLNGVYLESPENGIVRCVATDGHRLSMIDREAPGFTLPRGMILPRKGVAMMQDLLAEHPETEAVLELCEEIAVLRVAGQELSMRLVEGEFPDYRGVLPKGFKSELSISRDAMIASIKRVLIFANDRMHGVKLTAGQSALTVRSTSPETGEAEDSVELENGSATEISIGFNATYILQMLAILPKETDVKLCLIDDVSAGMFTSDADPSFKYVVMPMRL